jgi:hypothetical protein
MTDRERMLAAIRGAMPDRVPFVPRLEFWYRARQRDGRMPAEFRSLSLMEIADRLGVGFYAIVPDFTDAPEEDKADRALGIVQQAQMPFRVSIDRRVSRSGLETTVEYHTPVGTIRTAFAFTEEMLAGGVSDPCVTRYAIGEPRDFESVAYLFSHLRVEPQTAGLETARQRTGERGIVVAYAGGQACPIHHIMAELMPLEKFFYAATDCPATVEGLAEQMEPYYAQIKAAAASSPAEVVLLGSNYDDSITYPTFFRRHILPPLRDYAALLHSRGKFLMTHTDGENRKLLSLYLAARLDAADSVCPYPMTRCRLEEVREAFDGRITIVGGIPSILLCPGLTTLEEFQAFVDSALERYGHQSRMIFGVSDMVTADADWTRLEYIAERIARL